VCGATDGRGFAAAHAAEAEVVQFVRQERRVTGAHQRFAHRLFYTAAKRRDRDRIPNLKQDGFRPIGQPIKLRIGVFNSDDGILRANQRAFFDGLDSQRQGAGVFCVQTFPTIVVEALGISGKVLARELPRFFDIFGGKNLSGEVRFYDVLEAGHLHVIEKTAARANVGIDEARVRRVLPPVRQFIAIGVEYRVETKGLDGDLLICSLRLRAEASRNCHSWSNVKDTKRRRWSR